MHLCCFVSYSDSQGLASTIPWDTNTPGMLQGGKESPSPRVCWHQEHPVLAWSLPWAGPVLKLPARHEKAAFKAKHVLFHSPASENRDQLYSRQMLLRATFSDPFPTGFSAVTLNLGRCSQRIQQKLQHRLKEIKA